MGGGLTCTLGASLFSLRYVGERHLFWILQILVFIRHSKPTRGIKPHNLASEAAVPREVLANDTPNRIFASSFSSMPG